MVFLQLFQSNCRTRIFQQSKPDTPSFCCTRFTSIHCPRKQHSSTNPWPQLHHVFWRLHTRASRSPPSDFQSPPFCTKESITNSLATDLGQHPTQSSFEDLLIISLHVKCGPKHRSKTEEINQVGLSILDPRSLANTSTTHPHHESSITTHAFSLGSEKHFNQNSWRFCFKSPSQCEYVTLDSLRQKIHGLVKNRDTILVVHSEGGRSDGGIAMLEAAKIDLHPLYIIDTQKVSQCIFPSELAWPLGRILELLQCPFESGMLWDAGNVANAIFAHSYFLL